jgi:hypothetical protein
VLSGGTVDVVSGASDFGSFSNAGAVAVSDNATLTVSAASVSNAGAITLFGVDSGAAILLDKSLTLTGAGSVLLGGSGENAISAGTNGITLTNVNNTIAGAGTIGDGNALTLINSGTVNASGGLLEIDATSTTNLGLMEATSSGTLTFDGAVTNSGTIVASTVGAEIVVASEAVVSGGYVKVANGLVDVQSGATAKVAFVSNGSGGLDLDGTGAIAVTVSGFGVSGGTAHTDSVEFIDFTAIGSGATFSYTPANAANTSGTLIVSGGGITASVTLIGTYTSGNFVSHSLNGTTEITDPVVVGGGSVTSAAAFPANGLDLPQIAFDAHTTLGFKEDENLTGGTLTVANGTQTAAIALLGNYMAASFVTATDGHGGTLVTQDSQASQQLTVTHPHNTG